MPQAVYVPPGRVPLFSEEVDAAIISAVAPIYRKWSSLSTVAPLLARTGPCALKPRHRSLGEHHRNWAWQWFLSEFGEQAAEGEVVVDPAPEGGTRRTMQRLNVGMAREGETNQPSETAAHQLETATSSRSAYTTVLASPISIRAQALRRSHTSWERNGAGCRNRTG